MKDDCPLTTDQEKLIADTLKRIHEGLQMPLPSPFIEPSHIFVMEVFDEQ